MKTETSANYIAVGSEDTYVPDHKTSVTGCMWHRHKGEKRHNRVSLLQDIYTNKRMLEIDPRPEKVWHGTRRRVTQSHCLTGFRISREQGHHEPVDRLDEWIGEVHLFSPASTFWPERGVVSNTDLGARPKVSSSSLIDSSLGTEILEILLLLSRRQRRSRWRQAL